MALWQFFDYITEGNENHLSIWYGALQRDEQVTFDLLVKQLSETEDWDATKKSRRKHKELERDDIGLTQLMFESYRPTTWGTVFRKQFRAIGIWMKDEWQFIFLNGCQKRGFLGDIPPDAFKHARHLKAQFEANRGSINEHKVI
jgi:hypothetical protein